MTLVEIDSPIDILARAIIDSGLLETILDVAIAKKVHDLYAAAELAQTIDEVDDDDGSNSQSTKSDQN